MDTSRASTLSNAELAIYRDVVRLFEMERIGCFLLRHAIAAPAFPPSAARKMPGLAEDTLHDWLAVNAGPPPPATTWAASPSVTQPATGRGLEVRGEA